MWGPTHSLKRARVVVQKSIDLLSHFIRVIVFFVKLHVANPSGACEVSSQEDMYGPEAVGNSSVDLGDEGLMGDS